MTVLGIFIGLVLLVFALCPLLAWIDYRMSYKEYLKAIFERGES